MQQETIHHTPVLADAVSRLACVTPGETWVDCTLGFAGHAQRILADGATLIGIDQDSDARRYASKRLASHSERVRILAGNFRYLKTLLNEIDVSGVDGILADIGVSSYQLDQDERGFSFRRVGPVDMRMDRDGGETALQLIERLSKKELARILRKYGEEPFANPIAGAIHQWKDDGGPLNTQTLADAIRGAIPKRVCAKLKHHPATRSFQALRIAVNEELTVLDDLLDAIPEMLKPGGRALIISFHSLEDRIVKKRFNEWAGRNVKPGPRGRTLPSPVTPTFELLANRPIVASQEECQSNPRARTAKLRGVRKLELAA